MPVAMRYQSPEVQQRLACAYVTGTLGAAARRRFDSLRHELPELDRVVRQFDAHLQPLADAVPDAAPRPAVWRNIEAAIAPSPAAPAPWWQRVVLLRALAAVSTAAAILLAVTMLLLRPVAGPRIDYVAVLESSDGQALFVATTSEASRVLEVKALEPTAPAGDEDWQLWAVSKTDGEPRSLGLLDRSETTLRALSESGWRLVTDAESLIITVEARGGSAIGEPSDQVVSSGLCVRLRES